MSASCLRTWDRNRLLPLETRDAEKKCRRGRDRRYSTASRRVPRYSSPIPILDVSRDAITILNYPGL